MIGGQVRLNKREFTTQLRRLDLTDDFASGPIMEELLLSRVSVITQLLSQFVRDLSDLGFALTTLAACLLCHTLYGLESFILDGILRSDATLHFQALLTLLQVLLLCGHFQLFPVC
jgi:hypothetical protein